MVQLIAGIIFLVSFSIICLILYRKAPQLVQLPKNGSHGLKKPKFVLRFEKKIKDTHFHFFQKQMLLHKVLSKFRLWALKLEAKIDSVLQKIRKKAQELDKKTITKTKSTRHPK